MLEIIKNKIYEIRGLAVRRNIQRFSSDFMFELNDKELQQLAIYKLYNE